MSYLYLDSSALVKRYLTETGSAWVISLTDPTVGNTIVIAEITRVEVAAALASRHRMPNGISQIERERLFRLLIQHTIDEYETVPINAGVIDHAMRLTQRYRLRGYDAVQLAAALDSHATALAAGLPGLTMVSADNDLVAAALAEGFTADNPHAHP